jgi:hypothetical protein
LAPIEALLDARATAVRRALERVADGGQVDIGKAFLAEVLPLAEAAASACDCAGRPLAAANQTVPAREVPLEALWQSITVLREFRGDGHIAALVTARLDPCEALITHAGANDAGIGLSVLQQSRSWPDDEWAAAKARLTERGLLEGEALTEAGAALRARVEAETDEAASGVWAAISVDDAERLRALVRPWSRAIVESGVFGLR